jgi:hypothetical protein
MLMSSFRGSQGPQVYDMMLTTVSYPVKDEG